LLRSIHHAADLAREAREVSTPFDLWWLVYHAQRDWARAEGVAPLVAAFGVAGCQAQERSEAGDVRQ